MTSIRALSLAAGIVAAFISTAAFGQTAETTHGLVTGSGVATVKRPPELMRMRLELTASGKDISDALVKLKARREAALKICSELGATPASAVVGTPHIAAENPQQQQIMAMLRQRARNGGRPAKKSEAVPVNVAATLTAEWPLKGGDGEELLLASQTLENKIKANLAKSMPKEELSPEDEELQEEAAQEMSNYGNGNGPKPGEPTFLFVAKISNADYVKAASKAFAMAKEHAQRLADAAGVPLGELRSLDGNDRQSTAMMMNYRNSFGGNGMEDDEAADQESMPEEAVGLSPSEAKLTIVVGASFALGK